MLRWWDGRQWTSATQAAVGAPQQSYYAYPAGVASPTRHLYQQVWFWLVLIGVLFLGGCAAIVAVIGTAANKVVNDQHTVVYAVSGDGRADILYSTFGGSGSAGTASTNCVALPWSRTVTGKGDIATYSVSATLMSGHSVTCTIKIDGIVKTTQTSDGQLAFVDCIAGP